MRMGEIMAASAQGLQVGEAFIAEAVIVEVVDVPRGTHAVVLADAPATRQDLPPECHPRGVARVDVGRVFGPEVGHAVCSFKN